MVEVFKTNVSEAGEAEGLISLLLMHFPDSEINFDLEDCDKILRIKNHWVSPGDVIPLLLGRGYHCEVLPD